ncbi:adenylate/guanylate cyclase domain-containing protein [Spirochaeta isovalerica]|uniref:Class 3 adenylate cyclase n=1 Tax=Spirochaeta isovalerica TaxID=150 RepID=A0A841RBQ9_9SPIO|nr:adenylate/guanylate cyclase domain-containing protein [Spirochaeta isovalerica]MBB6481373.1 class 3 adenylate cyclase [Spirochaeta isovalerica]
MKKRRVPSYYIFRMILLPLIIYTMLILPVLLNLFTSNLLELIENRTIPVEFVKGIMEMRDSEIEHNLENAFERETKSVDEATAFFVWVQLSILVLFFAFNLPFRSYLKKKKRRRKIKPGLEKFCRSLINHTPMINSLLYLSGLVLTQMNQIKYFNPSLVENDVLASMFRQLFILSMVSSVLTALFLHSWQKYRVQMIYKEHFLPAASLRKRTGRLTFENVQIKLLLSSLMTTFLPLLVLIFYIFLNVSTIGIKSVDDGSKNLLLGEFLQVMDIFNLRESFSLWLSSNSDAANLKLYYIDVSGFLRMALGFVNGFIVSMLYIFFYLRWTNASITRPINEIVSQMKNMTKGKPSRYAVVRTKDEIGKLGEGFNLMVDGLREREKIKSLFGQYLTREISDEILNGHVDLGGDLYNATILFADIRNFTSISEKMSPKEVVDFLNSYLSGMIDVIIANNGIIDKFMGDGILAVFGVPVSSEDHAESGIKAALAMNEKLDELNKARQEQGLFPIKIGIGVHSGPVIGGNLGNSNKLEYTVIGDTVNVASRIENLTKRYNSSLIISGTTYENISSQMKKQINMKAIANAEIRGKARPLTLYSMLS